MPHTACDAVHAALLDDLHTVERELAEARETATGYANDFDALDEKFVRVLGERDEARRGYEALGKLDAANTDALVKAEATITRVKALVERWRSRYGTSRDACADELLAALEGVEAK